MVNSIYPDPQHCHYLPDSDHFQDITRGFIGSAEMDLACAQLVFNPRVTARDKRAVVLALMESDLGAIILQSEPSSDEGEGGTQATKMLRIEGS